MLIQMHKKNQELLTCNFVLLFSKTFLMLMTCSCNLVQLYATASQVFPALNFLLPCYICRIDNTLQTNVGFGWVWVCFGGGCFVWVWLGGREPLFPQASLPFTSKQAIFSCNKDFLLSSKTAGTKCMHHMLLFIICCIIKLDSFSLHLITHLDKDDRDLHNQKPDMSCWADAAESALKVKNQLLQGIPVLAVVSLWRQSQILSVPVFQLKNGHFHSPFTSPPLGGCTG